MSKVLNEQHRALLKDFIKDTKPYITTSLEHCISSAYT